MNASRPKLTRRRGACEECRQKKVRCDGANPCNHCQRNGSLCEYNLRRSRGHVREKSNHSPGEKAAPVLSPYATGGNTVPAPPNPESFPVVVSAQDAESSPNPLNTPLSEVSFSQLVSDSTHSYLDFDFSREAISNSNQAQLIDQQTSSFQNQIPYFTPSADMPMLDWLSPSRNQTLAEHGAVQFCDFVGIEQESRANECTLTSFSERIVSDTTTAKTKASSDHRTYKITALFQIADSGRRKQQTVVDKVKALLSSEHETCLSNLLRKIDNGGVHQSLILTDLPATKLVQRAFKELGGLGLFINEQDVTRIKERFFDSENLPMDASDVSLLVVSLAWGALLEPEMSSSSTVALLDAVLETSTLLLCQNNSVRKFLALVAVLSISEITGSNNLPALILTSISIAASLSLHLEPVLRKLCDGHEQVIHTQRAMWLLYCIDKSYALRWQTFSLVSDSFLPTTYPPGNILESDSAATPSLELLSVRSQFSKICSDILQLREGADEEPKGNCSTRATTLSTALEEWYRSTKITKMILSLNHDDVMRFKLQISYYHYEAQIQLLSTSLAYAPTSSFAKSQEVRGLLNKSTREIITCSSTISSEYLLQDCNHLFVNKLALCMLALDILLQKDEDDGKKSRAFLSMVAGLFARVAILLPETSVFEEVSDLIDTLTCH